VAPLLVSSIPLSVFTELHHRRNARLSDRFPSVLETLANARENGVPLAEAVELVARESGGTMADEMGRVRRDIALTDDVAGAFMAFAGRVHVGSISRSIHIVARGIRYTSDLSDVLRVTARDLRNRRQLQRERTIQMRLYTIVFLLGVLIYLGIVAMLVRSFFPQAQAMAEAGAADRLGLLSGDVTANLTAYRTAFYHSALLQVVGTSLVVGRLERNDVLSGLKYANVMAFVVVGVFLVL
jgi:flagellar protein FlaJ